MAIRGAGAGLHPVRLEPDTVGLLQFAHVAHDLRQLLGADLRLCGHVAKLPVVLPDTLLRRAEEGFVSVVSSVANN